MRSEDASTSQRSTSMQHALAAAERLLQPEDVLASVEDHAAGSLSHGLAGTALLHARLASVDPAFAAAAAQHWALAADYTRRRPGNSPGIFRAPGGLAASLIIGTPYLPDPDSQARAVQRAVCWLSTRAVEVSEQYRQPSHYLRAGSPWDMYDVINGLAGIGRVLLAAHSAGHPSAEPGLRAALDTLTTMIQTPRGMRPGWWLAPHGHPPGVDIHRTGAANTGMAHGIAGPLAFLAVAHTSGWTVPGQSAAIREASDWLLRWRTPAGWWPPYVTGLELDTQRTPATPGRHDAWCYGTPGISRALTLAGHALDDTELVETADVALAALTRRPAADWDAEGPTLCHGYGGVLQATATSAGPGTGPGTGLSVETVAEHAAAAATAAFNARHPFGFQHHDNDAVLDAPGFLTGAAGAALALADHGELPAPRVSAGWDCLLLVS